MKERGKKVRNKWVRLKVNMLVEVGPLFIKGMGQTHRDKPKQKVDQILRDNIVLHFVCNVLIIEWMRLK